MTQALVLPDPQRTTLPAIQTQCRQIFDRRDDVIGVLDVEAADGYRRQATAIEQFVGNREGRDAAPLQAPTLTELFSVQDLNAPDGRLGDRYHAWQKPAALAERFIRHATKPGDLVLDPFAGTGTFLVAAAQLGRAASGCDRDEDQVALCVDRGCVRA